MSSYLSIYIVPKRKSKEEPKQHIILAAYSRNTELYQYFWENIHPAFFSKGTEYTTLTKESVGDVVGDISKDIASYKTRLNEYEKYAKDNPEYINEIIDLKVTITDLEYWKGVIAFIEEMVDSVSLYDAVEEVCCNIG